MYIRFSLHLCNHLPDITKCCCLVPQLYPTLDYCPPGSSVHGIFQARILEWVVILLLHGMFTNQGSNLHDPNPSQHQGLFQRVNSLREVAKVLEFQL